MAAITKTALKALFADGQTMDEADFISFIDSCYNSFPMSIGSYLSTGSAFINDSSAGFYWRLAAGADELVVGNVPLRTYVSGADLNVKLLCRISVAPSGGDDVGLITNYSFSKIGDNSATEVTVIGQQDFVVDAETANINFEIDLGTLTGEASATLLLLGIERNSTGGGADSYGGNLEIIDVIVDYA